jgi:hypothetical protein
VSSENRPSSWGSRLQPVAKCGGFRQRSWPNFTLSINPGFPNLSVDVWIPDGPDHTTGSSETS